MSETLYIQTEKNIKVTSPVITLGDIAELSCSDASVLARNQVRKIASLPKDSYGRYVCSMIDVIKEIEKEEEHVDITHLGEPNFILTYENPAARNQILSWVKTIGVSLVTFIGTAFSIMTFNTDVSIRELFLHIYEMLVQDASNGFTILEITYSIGIGIGVVLYFNHFGKRKFTQDPTPLEVEMRNYEDEIDTTIIEQCDRAGKGGKGNAHPAVDPSGPDRT
ncbi:MAG: stage V sporulation protein AA [Fusicatenibacter sp.]|nr:stage V sporulation protein AA [Fusicatenibacter sp.]